MPMQTFRHLLLSDLRRLRKTPSVPLLWLAFPIALAAIEYGAFGQLGRGASGLPKGELLVADEDRTILSGVLAQSLQREPLSDFFTVVMLDTSTVIEQQLRDNRGSAALRIPAGFQDSVLAGAPVAGEAASGFDKPLKDATLLALYERFPHYVRGPFRGRLAPSVRQPRTALLKRAVDQHDEELVDLLASHLGAYQPRSGDSALIDAAQLLATYYAAAVLDDAGHEGPPLFWDLTCQSRWINHSCDPNAVVDSRFDRGTRDVRAWWVALRDIAPGEELTYDYAFAAEVAEPCACGSPRCRGLIVDPDELDQVPDELRRYLRRA